MPSSPNTAADAWLGRVVGGRWQILSLLDDSGGMASVYLADDMRLDRKAVVKIPKATHQNGEFAERFAREARWHAQVENVHVVTILDRGEEAGTPFLVLQYLAGGNLKAWCQRNASMLADPQLHFESWLLPIARALDAIAGRGIVHRDVKPSNILFDASGRGYLSDFGIVKAGDDRTLTGTGLFIGTLQFMSPEQCHQDGRQSLDGRSDQYGLGVTVYQVLTGWKFPVIDDTAVVYAAKFGHSPMTEPRDHVPLLPQAVNDAVMRTLSVDRDRRFTTSVEFANAVLAGFAPANERSGSRRPPTDHGQPTGPRATDPSTSRPQVPATPSAPADTAAQAQRPDRRRFPTTRVVRRVGWAAVTVGLVAAAIGTGIVLPGLLTPATHRADQRGSMAGEERRDNGLSMPLAWIPAGRFSMRADGSGRKEMSVHRGFWIGTHEVTLAEWVEVMGRGGMADSSAVFHDIGSTVSLSVSLAKSPWQLASWSGTKGDPVGVTIDMGSNSGQFVMARPQQSVFFVGHTATDGPSHNIPPPLVSTTIQLEPLKSMTKTEMDIDGRKYFLYPGRSDWRGNLGAGGRCLYGILTVVVSNDQSCWLARFPVSAGLANVGGLARHPVFTATLDEAKDFCVRLTVRERRAGRLPAGWQYRLPTEVEWERAARAGAATELASGHDSNTDNQAVSEARSQFKDVPGQVGTKPGNEWGIFDAFGNAPEWRLRSNANAATAANDGDVVGGLQGGGDPSGLTGMAGPGDVGGLRVVLAESFSE